jgi:hypothetical protein
MMLPVYVRGMRRELSRGMRRELSRGMRRELSREMKRESRTRPDRAVFGPKS